MIAICNPNHHGDVLWSVPAARALARNMHAQVDFWVGPRAKNLPDLLKAQGFVRDVFVVDTLDDVISPVGEYQATYQMSLKGWGGPETLLDYFCNLAGVGRQGHHLDLPDEVTAPSGWIPRCPYVSVAMKGYEGHEWRENVHRGVRGMTQMLAQDGVPVLEVGFPNWDDPANPRRVNRNCVTAGVGGLDRMTWGFLKMAWVISRCKVFVGTISAPLVIADAFPNVHRVAIHDGVHWNLNAVTKSPMNHYVVNTDARVMYDLVRGLL